MGMVKSIILIFGVATFHFVYLQRYFALNIAAIDAFVSAVITIIFAKIIETIQRYYHSSDLINITNIGQAAIFGAIATVFAHIICYNSFGANKDYIHFLADTSIFRFLLISIILTLLLAFFWADQQKTHLIKLNDFALQMERESIRIELESLQKQLKPHFLFNSLNSISALTVSNPVEARKMVLKLSDYMRYSVAQKETMTTLASEIGQIMRYIDIEKVRFGNRLNVDFEIDSDIKSLEIPSMILQPIIENAIKYGLYDSVDDVVINVHSIVKNRHLEITVSNPYDEETVTANKGVGYGLESVRKKLNIIYHSSNLITTSNSDGRFHTIIQIPLNEKNNNH
jgi:hypothetical protein